MNVSDKREDLPDALKTDNSGLELTADMLEEIFTNKDFPETAVPLEVSLAESGKSRADLWSFAAAVGVEWGVERNNKGCDGEVSGNVSSILENYSKSIFLFQDYYYKIIDTDYFSRLQDSSDHSNLNWIHLTLLGLSLCLGGTDCS